MGLDPNQKHEVRLLINRMSQDKCIVLSTHILEEVEEVCTRAVIISRGNLVADASPIELKQRSQLHGAISVDFDEEHPNETRESHLATLDGVRSVESQRLGPGRIRYVLFPEHGDAVLASLLRESEKGALPYTALRVEDGRLDEVFREITS